MAPKLKTIYQYFKTYGYTEEEVDIMLTQLSEEDMNLITLRYGNDLRNISHTSMNKREHNNFYNKLIPKMKKILAEIKENNQQISAPTENQHDATLNGNCTTSVSSTINQSRVKVQTTIEDKYFIEILEALKTPLFTQLMHTLTIKETVIVALKLGYINNKYFSNEAITEFLGIDQQEIIDTTKKALLLYNDQFIQFIDASITGNYEKSAQVTSNNERPAQLVKSPLKSKRK